MAAEFEKERGRDELIEQRGADQAADDDDGQRIQNFLAGLAGAHRQRNPADDGGQGRHQDGRKTLQAAPHDHLLVELLAFVLHEMGVVRNHHPGCRQHRWRRKN